MYHLDSSSDVVRLNDFNSDDVRFILVSFQLQETICRKLACVQTCPAGPNRSEFANINRAEPFLMMKTSNSMRGEKENEGGGRGSQPCSRAALASEPRAGARYAAPAWCRRDGQSEIGAEEIYLRRWRNDLGQPSYRNVGANRQRALFVACHFRRRATRGVRWNRRRDRTPRHAE